MYLKNIGIKNIGPISKLSVKLPFNENGSPKPLLFVGQNGSGKTILQSQIIDSLYEIGSNIFSDIGVQDINARSYYKLSGNINLKSGSENGFSLISYLDKEHNKIEYFDKIGKIESEEFKCFIDSYNLNPNNDNSNQKKTTRIENSQKNKLIKEWENGVHFYQPAYRYEEPFWKNEPFTDSQRFGDKRKFSGKLNKEIEIISSTRENKEYLMNLVLDFMNNPKNHIDKITWTNINNILKKIKRTENIRFGIGPRGGYRVSIVKTDENGNAVTQLLPSIDNLSLGESILLNLFINIVRYGDTPPKLPNQIKGIVAIDEIDVHLHSDLQNTILPNLIKMFPKVQFIITTHSPLFILGMKREFGEEGFEIRNMPNGEIITIERFSEFENAYNILKNTEKFEEEINKQIENSQKPIIFVEGDYDIRYIKKASKLLKKEELINKFNFIDADGYQNLNQIWKHKTNLFEAIPQDILLLYDCDTKIDQSDKNRVHKRIIPFMDENLFDRGIENLFSQRSIFKAREYKKSFIDYTSETKHTKRGKEIIIPEKYDVNLDEKGNLCDWLCKEGDKEDFINFDKVFKIFEEFLNNQ